MASYQLADGLHVPQIAFGTDQLKGQAGVETIVSAIKAGYTLLDTAYNYENEGTVGEAVRQSGVPRAQLLIESKLPGRAHGHDAALATIQESLYRSGLAYFDLYLLHWPDPIQNQYVEAWQALIEAKQMGLVRSIGVSNFVPEFLDRLERETGVKPVVNQIPFNPDVVQSETRAYDDAHDILTEDWSPLGGPHGDLFHRPVLLDLAAKYHKDVGQVVLRWAVQQGTLPISKSTKPARQMSNLDIFDFTLTDAEIAAITASADSKVLAQYPDPRVYEQF